MRIVIADDNSLNRRILERMVGRWGCEAVSTTDGIEAWEAIQRMGSPRLAILDWLMPGLDGIEVCRRARAEYPDAYLILLSARDDSVDADAGLSAGANSYLTKPINEAALRAAVLQGLERLGVPAPEGMT